MTQNQEQKNTESSFDLSKLNLEDIASKLSMVAIGVKTADSVMKKDSGALSHDYVKQTGEYVFGQTGFKKVKFFYENLFKIEDEKNMETETKTNQSQNSKQNDNQSKQISCVEYEINGKKYRGGILT